MCHSSSSRRALVCALVAPISDCDETFITGSRTTSSADAGCRRGVQPGVRAALVPVPAAARRRGARGDVSARRRQARRLLRGAARSAPQRAVRGASRAPSTRPSARRGAATLAFLLTAAGLFTRRSPSCRRRLRCTASSSTARCNQPDYAGASFGVAAAALLGWPLRRSSATARPRRARHHRPARLRPAERGGGGGAAGAGGWSTRGFRPPRRAAQHPVQSLAATGSGSQLYGVEAWHFYLQNLALNTPSSPRSSPSAPRGPQPRRAAPRRQRPPRPRPPGAGPQRRAALARLLLGDPAQGAVQFPIYPLLCVAAVAVVRALRLVTKLLPPRPRRALTYAALWALAVGGCALSSAARRRSSCTMARPSDPSAPSPRAAAAAPARTRTAAAAAGRRASAWARSGTASRRTSSCPPTPSRLCPRRPAASSPRPTSRRRPPARRCSATSTTRTARSRGATCR